MRHDSRARKMNENFEGINFAEIALAGVKVGREGGKMRRVASDETPVAWEVTGEREPEVQECRVSSVVEICSGQCWDGPGGPGWPVDERGEETLRHAGPKTNGSRVVDPRSNCAGQ